MIPRIRTHKRPSRILRLYSIRDAGVGVTNLPSFRMADHTGISPSRCISIERKLQLGGNVHMTNPLIVFIQHQGIKRLWVKEKNLIASSIEDI